MKNVKVKQTDVGRFVRVVFEDVGAMDGIITRVNGPVDFHFMQLGSTDGDMSNNAAPVLKIGNTVSAKDSGLD